MSEEAPDVEPVEPPVKPAEVADATGNEDKVVQTVFPPDEFPDPPQNDTDLGREAVVIVQGEGEK